MQNVGFENYQDLLTDSNFTKALWNTLYFALGTILPTILLGFLLALLFEKKFLGSGLFRTVLFSPWITPAVAVSLVWSWIYDPEKGLANYVLSLLHIAPLEWLQSSIV